MSTNDPKAILNSILEIVQAVIKDPSSFYRQMPKIGGYADPFVFAVAMGLAAGVIRLVMGLFGFSFSGFFMMVIMMLIIVPVLTGLFTFVGAAVLFAIWRLMGSQEEYEVSYRCAAYALAITPITTLLNYIPYLGVIIGLAWMAYVLVCASVEVHGMNAKTSWMVFGAIFIILGLGSLSAEYSARSFQHRMDKMGKGLGDIEKMKPDEAGQAVGEFLKGMQKGMDKK